MKWQPADDELDAIARSIEPSASRNAEQTRTALLAGAATRRQQSRRSAMPFVAAGCVLAVAAATMIWISVRPHEPSVAVAPKQTITPLGAARFETVSGWLDFVIRVDDGAIAVQVATVDLVERFRVKTADAELETRGARFDLGVDAGRLRAVHVQAGYVQIRLADQHVVVLGAGESWGPVKIAIREQVELPAPPPVIAPAIKPHPHVKLATPGPRTPEVVVVAKPGEADFRAGMTAMRGGDAATAAKSFAAACTSAQHDALGEDACFWAGASARRAGDIVDARSALTAFLQQFASSSRAPEASALLGWILFDANELDAAEARFHAAEHDRVPEVSASAQRGLTAVAHKRQHHDR